MSKGTSSGLRICHLLQFDGLLLVDLRSILVEQRQGALPFIGVPSHLLRAHASNQFMLPCPTFHLLDYLNFCIAERSDKSCCLSCYHVENTLMEAEKEDCKLIYLIPAA